MIFVLQQSFPYLYFQMVRHSFYFAKVQRHILSQATTRCRQRHRNTLELARMQSVETILGGFSGNIFQCAASGGVVCAASGAARYYDLYASVSDTKPQ